MKNTTIFSIGHGNKNINEFIGELKYHEIFYLIDVRSTPYSKWNPQYNQATIEGSLKNDNISYVYLGDKLGGLPSDRSCYIDGKVEYDLVKQKDFFIEGLNRLLAANEKNVKVAVMCSETNPADCHRSKLIGQELLSHGISIKHIVTGNKIKSQEAVMAEVTKGVGIVDLFGDKTNLRSRKKY